MNADLEENTDTRYIPTTTSNGLKKKRVCKACDSCRIKKTKCNGVKPCLRCITNNKICTYTERRRSKDKSYPAGYVELLETRLDILTRSLKKLFELSESGENISFLRSETTGELSINKLITKLVDKEDLFKNQPVEWEYGTSLASNFQDDEEYLRSASAEFAEHSRQIINYSNENKVGKKGRGRYKRSNKANRTASLTKGLANHAEEESEQSNSSASSYKSPTEVKSEYRSGIEKLGFNIDLGPFQSGSALATAALKHEGSGLQLSDFESDGEDASYHSTSFSPPEYQYQFLSFDSSSNLSPKNNSISSMTSLDNLNVSSPSTNSPFNDLSTHQIQSHKRQTSLPNPTLASQSHVSLHKPSILKTVSPTVDANMSNEMVSRAMKTKQSLSEQPEMVGFEMSGANPVMTANNDFNGIGNIIEPSRIISNGFDDLLMANNNPIPYNVS